MIRAAGILFLAPPAEGQTSPRVLMVRRGDGGDYPGTWGFPGGRMEDFDESLEACAVREAKEECGAVPAGKLAELMRTVTPHAPNQDYPTEDVDFTTFVQRVDAPFEPTLNYEHTGYDWTPAEPGNLPLPTHPGAALAVRRLTMNELGVAEAIRDRELASPQQYDNIWLFDIRITGVGAAYRVGLDEYVWRNPANYMNEAFMRRCAGLPVIVQHPEPSKKNDSALLNTAEFASRVIGTVFVPYLRDDGVWAVVKIWDQNAARIMRENRLSTSPAVGFKPTSGNVRMQLEEGGSHLLVEGDPSLLDHIAICPRGVWDKGGEPTGVRVDSEVRADSSTGEGTMAEKTKEEMEREDAARRDAEEKAEKEKADAARRDADAGVMLDKILTKMDSMSRRMDAWEEKEKEREDKARRDAEESEAEEKAEKEKADKARKDDEAIMDKAKRDAEEKEEKEKADSARRDAEISEKVNAGIAARLADIERRMPANLTTEDRLAMATAQQRADAVYSLHGNRAPAPLVGEDLAAYRLRLVSALQCHSEKWKGSKLTTLLADANAFANVEGEIYADAEAVGRSPVTVGSELREVRRTDESGRQITEFFGDPKAWLNPDYIPRQAFRGIDPKAGNA